MGKSGDWQTGQKIYANAKLSRDYATWKFAAVLEARIAEAQAMSRRSMEFRVHRFDRLWSTPRLPAAGVISSSLSDQCPTDPFWDPGADRF